MNGNVIRTITIRGTSEGLDKLQTDLVKLAGAHKGVAIAAEETDKKTRTLEQAWKQQTLRLDEAARAQNNIARESKIANQMLHEQRITTEQHAERLTLINQRYATTSKATQEFGKQTGLARHELINLGRQAQDVGVSLVSGQSPLMVLAQQGSQIADVFISSGTSVGTFFSQAIGWAGRFVTSTAGVVTGIGAIAAGALYMASSWASAQKEIDRALAGLGAASGMTRDSINRLAEALGGMSGMSVSAAREAATVFAATGKIYEQNIASAIMMTRDLALAMGVDTATAARTLAEALVDPSKGALDLNKQFGFLDATTLNYIRTLQSHNQLQEAQRVLMDASAESIKKQAEMAGFWTRAWNDVTASADLYSESLRKVVTGLAQLAEQATGVNLGGFTDEQQLERARAKLEELRLAAQSMGGGFGEAARAAEAEVARLEQKLLALGIAAQGARLDQLSLEADAFTRALIPSIAEAERLTEAIWKMEEAKSAGLGGPHMDAAIRAAEQQLNLALQTTAALDAQANVVSLLAQQYPGMTIEMARQQAILDGEWGTLQRIAAAEAEIEQYLIRIEQLRRDGLTLEEAELKIVEERAKGEEKIAVQMDKTAEKAHDYVNAFRSGQQMADNTERAATNVKHLKDEMGGAASAAGSFAKNMQLAANQTQSISGAIITWHPWISNLIQLSDPPQHPGTAGGSFRLDPLGLTAQRKNMEELYGDSDRTLVEREVGPSGTLSHVGENKYLEFKPTTHEEIMARAKERQEKLDKNTEAIKANTAATQTMTDVLSPYYSTDPRRTHLGFRSFAGGGIMTAHGELPLKQYQGGGVASSPQVAVYGEGSTPEAYVPVPSGRIPVEIKQPANSNQRPIHVTINVMGDTDANTVSALKSTAFQQAQAMRRAMR